MQRLGLETLDMYLIHWAILKKGAYRETWKAFVRLKQEGRVRFIGVSNFNVSTWPTSLMTPVWCRQSTR